MNELHDYLSERYAAPTARLYAREIEIYRSNCPGADQAGFKEVMTYIGRLRKRYPNAGTVRRILCSLKAYYQYLTLAGKRTDNPAVSVRLRDPISTDIQLQDLLTPDELGQLLHKEERYTLLATRNKVLMGLLIHQALQPRELEDLRTEDIDLEAGTVRVRAQANTNGRTLSLRAAQVLLMLNYLQVIRKQLLDGRQSDRFLVGLRGGHLLAADIIKHVTSHYGSLFHPRKVSCRTIRASVITNLLKAEKELRAVQVFAGHRKISATEKYRQDQVQALHSIIQARHPMK
ncbi:tyrosine-type recombinase/integrase [Hufsiella ginkgonis]|uniref:Tyrosine-type recombinase/integrase n=1 Tax=Hufsiella ginkgonis TaxID=2695274 RepID=A0A7K1XSC1_9SPHI|nr:tyrosine-type recombinase/integrase [Hufsiella ginkgonis]MXV13905.1 tyrosine-type recombinase/integrase [Hufsiella ginkgonis]MXV13913.1 tyrosine-type recombinase/integrase [Hufsiella ginkgonis]